VGRLKKRVAMWFLKKGKWNNIVVHRKTIIWQLFRGYVYYPVFVVAKEMSDVCAGVGVHLRAVQTPLTRIHVLLAK
jgi:hypothetical protein